MSIALAGFAVLFFVAILTGFIKFGEPGPLDEASPIVFFRVDNTYNLMIKGFGGITFITWFAVIFIGADGDTVSRIYGWENPNPKLD